MLADYQDEESMRIEQEEELEREARLHRLCRGIVRNQEHPEGACFQSYRIYQVLCRAKRNLQELSDSVVDYLPCGYRRGREQRKRKNNALRQRKKLKPTHPAPSRAPITAPHATPSPWPWPWHRTTPPPTIEEVTPSYDGMAAERARLSSMVDAMNEARGENIYTVSVL